MARIVSGIAALVTLAALLAGCGQDASHRERSEPGNDGEGPVPAPTSEVVVSWSEADRDSDPAWLKANREPRLLGTDAQRDAFIGGLPEQYADAAAALREVDLGVDTLLVAGFSQCGNEGAVVVDGEQVRHVVRKLDDIQCVWAPVRVDVFRVSGTSLQLRR